MKWFLLRHQFLIRYDPKMSSLVILLVKVSTKHCLKTNPHSLVGAFGLVKVGWLRSDPSKKFAIKSMKKHEIIQSKHVDHIENEKNILSKMDHPFGVSTREFV